MSPCTLRCHPARYAACALRCHPARSRRVQSPHGSITLHGFCDFAQNDTVEGRSVCHPARYAACALRCHPARSRRVQSPHGSITLHGFCDFAQNDTVEGRSVCHPARYAVPLHATPPARYAVTLRATLSPCTLRRLRATLSPCALRCHPARSRRVQSPHGSITLHGFCDFAQNDTVEGRSVCHPARYAVTLRAVSGSKTQKFCAQVSPVWVRSFNQSEFPCPVFVLDFLLKQNCRTNVLP